VLVMAEKLYGNPFSGFDRLDPSALLWFAPLGLMMLGMAAVLVEKVTAEDPLLTVAIVVTMALVGVAEEGMFRGIVLRGLLNQTTRGWAILISSALFSGLHLLNLLAFSPPVVVAGQMVFTLAFGLTFACLTVRANALWPGMILHGLWDMLLFCGVKFRIDYGMLTYGCMAAVVLTGLALWFGVLRKPDGFSSSAR
jgi:uncharacterized protein